MAKDRSPSPQVNGSIIEDSSYLENYSPYAQKRIEVLINSKAELDQTTPLVLDI